MFNEKDGRVPKIGVIPGNQQQAMFAIMGEHGFGGRFVDMMKIHKNAERLQVAFWEEFGKEENSCFSLRQILESANDPDLEPMNVEYVKNLKEVINSIEDKMVISELIIDNLNRSASVSMLDEGYPNPFDDMLKEEVQLYRAVYVASAEQTLKPSTDRIFWTMRKLGLRFVDLIEAIFYLLKNGTENIDFPLIAAGTQISFDGKSCWFPVFTLVAGEVHLELERKNNIQLELANPEEGFTFLVNRIKPEPY